MANRLNWTLGHEGKGNYYGNGDISTWNIDEIAEPHHEEMADFEGRDHPAFRFYITPEGGLHDGGITFTNQTPYSDDQVVKEIVAQHPAVWDARGEVDNDFELAPRIPTGEGGYGHAERLLAKKAKEEGWADFHTELKLPRGTRKRIRRWVDRLKWPEGSTKEDARRYHVTILSMDEYDEDFAKWAKQQMQGRSFTFKSTGMAIFGGEHVVLRLDCPEWTEVVLEWQKQAEEKGLEPHKFNPPKAHVTVGKSPSGKWPQGVPDPHVTFTTRMFNINKNAAISLQQVLDSLRPSFVQAAQRIYNEWDQTEGFDEEFGGGGICDAIADEISNLIGEQGIQTLPGGQDGEDHAWVIATNGQEAFEVDIHPSVYERGAGFNWEKIPGVTFAPSDITISPIPPEWLGDLDSFESKTSMAVDPEAIERIASTKTTTSQFNPAIELRDWLNSLGTENSTPPISPHHTDAEQLQSQDREPVVTAPHVDPPSNPYEPYDWASQGWQETQLDRTSADIEPDTHACPRCNSQLEGHICPVCGYDPQDTNDYDQAKHEWYDRAWSDPESQPRPVPHQPMHWRHDNATDVKFAGTDQRDNVDTVGNVREVALQGSHNPPTGEHRLSTGVDQEATYLQDSKGARNEMDHFVGWNLCTESRWDFCEPQNDLHPLWAEKRSSGPDRDAADADALPQMRQGVHDPTSVGGWREI